MIKYFLHLFLILATGVNTLFCAQNQINTPESLNQALKVAIDKNDLKDIKRLLEAKADIKSFAVKDPTHPCLSTIQLKSPEATQIITEHLISLIRK